MTTIWEMGGEIRVLGPLIVEAHDGEPPEAVVLGPAQRRLLAMLCATPGDVVSVDRLQEGLGLSSSVSVRSTVSRLRRLIGEFVHQEAPGYLVESAAVDAVRFRGLLAEARSVESSGAVSLYDQALGLWRGSAFGEFADEEWAMGEAVWLDQAKVAAQEERIEALIATGRLADAAADAERLVVEHPLRERPRAQLMQSLMLDGRQAEALRVFQDFRRFLADEVGTTPSRELVDLEQQIVAGELGLESAGPARPMPKGTRRGNLRERLSSFVGRSTAVAEVSQLLTNHRLVTLVGPGGIGKTRLSIEVAARSADKFADGVWLAELGVVADGSGVADRVMAALGIQPGEGQSSEDRICSYLAERSALVVIDNCEHVLAGASQLVGRILQGAPQVKVIATSREPLLIDGERVLAVPPLTVDVDSHAGGEAVELFVERALSGGSRMVVDETTLRTAAKICSRLDGLPLAIELAASRCRSMGISDVARRLDERFQLLTGGQQGGADRHRTLQATVDWSYELLSDVEQLVFDRLSVFAGWFSLEDGLAVASQREVREQGEVCEQGVVDGLTSLVDKSMCVLDTTGGTGSYRLLETMRAYGQANLDGAGRLEAMRRRHAEHYRDVLVAALKDFVGPDEAAVGARCLSIAPELRAGLHWAANAGEIDLAMEYLPTFAICGWRAWWVPHSWVAEIEHLLPRTPLVLACLFGHSMSISNDYLRCRRLTAEAIALNDPSTEMAYMYAMGAWIEVSLGDFASAERLSRIGCELGEASGEALPEAVGRFFYSEIRLALGQEDNGTARRLLDRGSALGWPSAQAAGLYLVARRDVDLDPVKAVHNLHEAIGICEQVANPTFAVMSRLFLLELHVGFGELGQAAQTAIEIFQQFNIDGLNGNVIWASAGVATVLSRAGNHRAAATVGGYAMSRSDGFTLNRQVEEALDHGRIELGAEFSEFDQQGRVMSTKELIDYATDELRQIVDG